MVEHGRREQAPTQYAVALAGRQEWVNGLVSRPLLHESVFLARNTTLGIVAGLLSGSKMPALVTVVVLKPSVHQTHQTRQPRLCISPTSGPVRMLDRCKIEFLVQQRDDTDL